MQGLGDGIEGCISFIDEFLETKSFQNKTLKGSENATQTLLFTFYSEMNEPENYYLYFIYTYVYCMVPFVC